MAGRVTRQPRPRRAACTRSLANSGVIGARSISSRASRAAERFVAGGPATSRPSPGGGGTLGRSPRLPGLDVQAARNAPRIVAARLRVDPDRPAGRSGSAVVEAGLVGQEAVAVGVDQLHDLERLAAVPRRRRWRTAAPTRRARRGRSGSAARCRAGRRARRRAGSRCRRGAGRRPGRAGRGRRPASARTRRRRGSRRGRGTRSCTCSRPAAGRSSASGGTGSTANPSVSIIHSIFSACGRWKSGSSTDADRTGGPGRYRHRRAMYRFLLHAALDRLPPARASPPSW